MPNLGRATRSARYATPAANPPLCVTIVSASALLREGLRALLLSMPFVQTVGVAAEGTGPALLPGGLNIALIDGGDLSQALSWLAAWARADARLLVIELAADADAILGCIEAGAHAYTLRGDGPDDLLDAMSLLQAGQARCDPALAPHLFARLARLRQEREPLAQACLSEREREVLQLLVADYSNQQIAERLVIEVRTVKHHVHNILEKLHVRHRWEAARLAVAHGLLDAPQAIVTPSESRSLL